MTVSVAETLKFYRFRNVKAGEPFDAGYLSADYNRHVLFGYENYLKWRETHPIDTITAAAPRPGY